MANAPGGVVNNAVYIKVEVIREPPSHRIAERGAFLHPEPRIAARPGMTTFAIRSEHLGKRYRLGMRPPYYKMTDLVTALATRPIRTLRRRGPKRSASPGWVWALEDVSFEIGQGDVVGIIGRNGAGKSTLLKVLSRITEPTRGEVRVRGRVGSLLEVGTGFHPELTGRENVFLNGAILGMKQAEIARKFDQIVAFAETERFLDTPVKHYSSGMYMRLAFAVAAHLEPEVLIVDEVLAVGDASFQKKCLNKMAEVGGQGSTVLFVSHNIQAVTRLCPRAMLLDQGRLIADGTSGSVIQTYLQIGAGLSAERTWRDRAAGPGNSVARLSAVRVVTPGGEVTPHVDIRRPVGIAMEFDVLRDGQVLVPNVHLYNEQGACVFVALDTTEPWRRRPRSRGRYTATAWIPGNFLAEGTHVVHVALSTLDPVTVHFQEPDAVAFQVVDSLDGDSSRGDYGGPMPGVVRPMLEWTTQFVPEQTQGLALHDAQESER